MKYLYDSPIGPLTMVFSEKGLMCLSFGNWEEEGTAAGELAEQVSAQLDAYFSGQRKGFSVPLDLHGSPFQKQVWEKLLEIPYGQTETYGEVAKALGKPGAARAVGMAFNRNPVPVIVHCHRVLGASGDLTGYGGGLDKKVFLLSLERQNLNK